MPELLLFFVAGFAAALVDGALGMGFGPTSSSILLGTGASPAVVGATVNLAKVATGLSGAIAHLRFSNIDRRLVLQLAIPGGVGAAIGATVLARVDGDQLKPILALLLLAVAARILIRFSRPLPATRGSRSDIEVGTRPTAAVATIGGVTNGLVGAWGPVVTPYLLHHGVAPRFAVGSVNTAEVAVAVVASGSLVASVGAGAISVGTVVGILLGGVVAAPVAAWSIQHLPARVLGIAVAGLLFVTNLRELARAAGVGAGRWFAYALVLVACVAAALRPRVTQAAREPEPALTA